MSPVPGHCGLAPQNAAGQLWYHVGSTYGAPHGAGQVEVNIPLLSKRAKFGYLVLAIITMLTLALASISAAQGWVRWSAGLFILSLLEVGGGFTVRRRVLRCEGR